MIVGIDEAGRGPLAGPVVACALVLKEDCPTPFLEKRKREPVISRAVSDSRGIKRSKLLFSRKIRDSKQLSPARREDIFHWACAHCLFGVGIADNREIDRINILEAAFLAFDRAIKALLDKEPQARTATFIVDGTMFKNGRGLDYLCLKQADSKVREVALASVVAKVFRDHLMNVADCAYPDWNFSAHKGYGTSDHLERIDRYSVSPLHRKTFGPCCRSTDSGRVDEQRSFL